MQGRDPFSGDCDDRGILSWGWRPTLLPTCKDETRFQGIATVSWAHSFNSTLATRLQGRDPFSGDCDGDHRARLIRARAPTLQGRDPFSGDCDCRAPAARLAKAVSASCKDETRFQGIATPGNRSSLVHKVHIPLARTRPVFRGLRRLLTPRRMLLAHRTCRDETRFQGIARPPAGSLRGPTSRGGLARMRPVFRGLRPPGRRRPSAAGSGRLQGRDPFSGDCDVTGHGRLKR